MINVLEVILWVVAVTVATVASGGMGWMVTHTSQIAQIWPPHSQYHKEAMKDVKVSSFIALIFVPVLLLSVLASDHPWRSILVAVLLSAGFAIGFKRGMREDAEVRRERVLFELLEQEALSYLETHPDIYDQPSTE